MSTPTTTATRSGSRVRVTRTDDVLPGHQPIITVVSDDAEALAFSPTTARALIDMLRAAVDAPPAPSSPQQRARDVLRGIGIDVPDDRAVVLTDRDDTGDRVFTYLINPGQLAAACEEHRLATGESVDGDALVAALPWKEV
ncbi:hypothetical protein [Gordonia sp. MP11Mi]|uniref:Uncharacterized protein n=1 Tax=Gordonia sp. MP11Mi TaxID=3022769 RepID=A0AA97CXG2_9ACTN